MFPQRERPGQRTNPSGNPVATPPVCAVPGEAAPVATTDPSRPRSPGHGEPYRARRGHPEPSRHVRWGHPGLSRTQTPPSSPRPEPSRAPGRSADRDDPRRRRQRRRGLHTLQLDAGHRQAPAPSRTPQPTETEVSFLEYPFSLAIQDHPRWPDSIPAPAIPGPARPP